jgi:hypothetical protein
MTAPVHASPAVRAADEHVEPTNVGSSTLASAGLTGSTPPPRVAPPGVAPPVNSEMVRIIPVVVAPGTAAETTPRSGVRGWIVALLVLLAFALGVVGGLTLARMGWVLGSVVARPVPLLA